MRCKSLVFIFFVALTNAELLEDLNKSLNEIKKRMCNEIPELNLPILEPFTDENFQFHLGGGFGNINGTFQPLIIEGLKETTLTNLTYDVASLTVKLQISVPKLILHGYIEMFGTLANIFLLNGEGDFDALAENLVIDVDIALEVVDISIHVKSLNIVPSISSLTTDIEGLFKQKDMNDFLNEMLDNEGPQLIVDNWDELKEGLYPYFIEITDNILATKPLLTWLSVVLGFSSPLPKLTTEECLLEN